MDVYGSGEINVLVPKGEGAVRVTNSVLEGKVRKKIEDVKRKLEDPSNARGVAEVICVSKEEAEMYSNSPHLRGYVVSRDRIEGNKYVVHIWKMEEK